MGAGNAMSIIPNRTVTEPMSFPPNVFGVRSPNPSVVKDTSAYHAEWGIDLNSVPGSSVNKKPCVFKDIPGK